MKTPTQTQKFNSNSNIFTTNCNYRFAISYYRILAPINHKKVQLRYLHILLKGFKKPQTLCDIRDRCPEFKIKNRIEILSSIDGKKEKHFFIKKPSTTK